MRVLITGGFGFIGSHLVRRLLLDLDTLGVVPVVLDLLTEQIHGAAPQSHLAFIREGVEFLQGDVCSQDVLETLLPTVDAVVHLAAETGTGQSMYQIARYNQVNHQAFCLMLELIATKYKNVRKVVFASSRSIYGEGSYSLAGSVYTPSSRSVERLRLREFEPVGPAGEELLLIPTPESAELKPASVYAATKVANELVGRIVAEAYGVDIVALRFQNVYGEGQSLANPYTGLLSVFSNRLRSGRSINVFEDGLESRDFVHVSDAVNSIVLALTKSVVGFSPINIGSGVATPVISVATLLRELLDSSSEIVITGDFRAGDIRHCYADLSVSASKLGFAPLVSLAAGFGRYVAWVKTQEIPVDKSDAALRELAVYGLSSSVSSPAE